MSEKRIITPEEVMEKTPERFWSKIKFAGEKECWEWQACIGSHGYGEVSAWPNGRTTSHRFMFDKIFGIPVGMWVLHECDNKECCNPNHLFLGTHQDNITDMVKKGRGARGSKQAIAVLTEADVVEIKQMLLRKVRLSEIATIFKISRSVISNIRRGIAWKHVDIGSPMPYLRKGNPKLTADKVRLIKMRLSLGETHRSIAKAFNISQPIITSINTGKIWKEVVLQ